MKVLQFAIIGFLVSVVLGVVAIAALLVVAPTISYKVEASELSSKEKIMSRNNTGIVLLDRKGDVFYSFYQARHISPVPLQEIPLHTRQAVMAAEDKEFYSHTGYSLRALTASAVANIRQKEAAYGGSTITQQLAKTAFLTPEKSWQRKVQELLLARELEEKYSKDEILEMYMNSVYFGEGAFGIEDASQTYFSKPAKELNVAQSSLLAGILTAPSAYSPITGDKEAAISRQKAVLGEMKELGFITEAERQTAEKADWEIKQSTVTETFQAPHFALMVRKALIDEYGEQVVARSGYIVRTTIDLDWQKSAEDAVREQVAKLAKNKVSNGAAVVMEPKTGEVRAVVGSKDWNDPNYGKFNVATAHRQPGSSFKPFVYLTGFEKNIINPASILKDVPTTFGRDYRPLNYDKRFRGRVTVRRSLANSLNVPTVDVQQKVGVPATLDLAKRLGITSLDNFSPNDLSVSLGSGETSLYEMTNAYATLARGGMYQPAVLYTEIKNKEGKTIFQSKPEQKQSIERKHAFLLTSILSDNDARREVFGSNLTISRPAAVKTGTSNDYKDSWTIGYTPSLTIGVWVGNNDGTLMDNVAGSLGAAPIWRTLMEKFVAGTPVENFDQPSDVLQISVCRSNGQRAPEGATGSEFFKEYFAQGTEPTQTCNQPAPSPSPTAEATPENPAPTPESTVDPVQVVPVGGNPKPTIEPLPTLVPIEPSPTPNPTEEPTDNPDPTADPDKRPSRPVRDT